MYRSYLSYLNRCVATLAIAVASTEVVRAELPTGWYLAGSNPQDYESGLDSQVYSTGRASAYIKSRAGSPRGFATLMQDFKADRYRGKRIRLSAYIKSLSVQSWAGLWMRVDGEGRQAPLAFDNMQNRPIKGTSDWTRYDVVLDVPQESAEIFFGVLLEGTGTVWIDRFEFEVVNLSVAVTSAGMSHLRNSSKQPVNLEFEDGTNKDPKPHER